MLKSKAVTRKHVVAVIIVVLVLATISSVFAVQQLATRGQDTNAKNNTLSPINDTTPTATDEPTPTPKPSPSPTSTPIPIPVNFTIPIGLTVAGSSNVFTVYIDLNDGMNRDEAITVAETILNRELTNAIHVVKSAEVSSEGMWNVDFNWEYPMTLENGTQITPVLGHFFDVIINPQNQTATYTRCG